MTSKKLEEASVYKKLGIPPRPEDPEELRAWKRRYYGQLYGAEIVAQSKDLLSPEQKKEIVEELTKEALLHDLSYRIRYLVRFIGTESFTFPDGETWQALPPSR